MHSLPARPVALLAAVSIAALGLLACDSGAAPAEDKLCIPNQTDFCLCAGGGTGVQACNAEGSGYTVCDCGDGGGGDTPVDDTADETGDDTGECVAETLYHAKGCVAADVFWFDDCGAKTEFVKACEGNQPVCNAGECGTDACPPNFKKDCVEGAVYWFDKCDTRGEFVETCPIDTFCSAGECIEACSPHAYKLCSGNNVFWYDSCDTQESTAETCEGTEYCTTDKCLKGVYEGAWYVTEDPNKPGGGGGLGSFVPNTFTLTANGDEITMIEPVLGNQATYTGDLAGKSLLATGAYSAGGLDQYIQIQVTFAADPAKTAVPPPHQFTGVYITTVKIDGIGDYVESFNILGVKQ